MVRMEQDELAVNKTRYLSHFPKERYDDRPSHSDKKKPIVKKSMKKPYGPRDETLGNKPYRQRDTMSSDIRTPQPDEAEMVKGTCFSYQRTGKCARGKDCPYETH